MRTILFLSFLLALAWAEAPETVVGVVEILEGDTFHCHKHGGVSRADGKAALPVGYVANVHEFKAMLGCATILDELRINKLILLQSKNDAKIKKCARTCPGSWLLEPDASGVLQNATRCPVEELPEDKLKFTASQLVRTTHSVAVRRECLSKCGERLFYSWAKYRIALFSDVRLTVLHLADSIELASNVHSQAADLGDELLERVRNETCAGL